MPDFQGIVLYPAFAEHALVTGARRLRVSEVVGEIRSDQFLAANPGDFLGRAVDVGDLAIGRNGHQRGPSLLQ